MGGGDKGANFVFRVMGVITSEPLIGSIFQIPILCVLRLRRYVCVCVGGGGGKLGFFFSGHFRFLVVSLQFEPADARVLVEHPFPRCPSCTPALFGVHVNSPPSPSHFLVPWRYSYFSIGIFSSQ